METVIGMLYWLKITYTQSQAHCLSSPLPTCSISHNIYHIQHKILHTHFHTLSPILVHYVCLFSHITNHNLTHTHPPHPLHPLLIHTHTHTHTLTPPHLSHIYPSTLITSPPQAFLMIFDEVEALIKKEDIYK